ncbi:hypothetical protein VKT23_012692 [Stygiomarasmius scandens]|uniref:Uncharacterized protein n=1 Tax=Marasmiellus scandens TaxID=2682957 RepID=A0ABR1J7K8_9AGAR
MTSHPSKAVGGSEEVPKEHKILLLGLENAGKSTVLKQLRILYSGGFSDEERDTYREVVYDTLLNDAHTIIDALKQGEEGYPNQALVDEITNYRIQNPFELVLTEEIVDALRRFWEEPTVQKVAEENAASSFLKEVQRIGSQDYLPTDMDILRARQKSPGITETRCSLDDIPLHVISLEGPDHEWSQYAKDVETIIFCTSLSDYDRMKEGRNLLAESIELFGSIVNAKCFSGARVCIFMNKIDEFKEKIHRVPFSQHFPEYTFEQDTNKAAKFILWKMMQTNKAKLSIYPHLTEATDATMIKHVFDAVKEIMERKQATY